MRRKAILILGLWALAAAYVNSAAPAPQVNVGAGGGSGITSGSTAISGGTDTSVCFDDAGVMNCGDTGLSFTKASDRLSVGVIDTAGSVALLETADCATFEGTGTDALEARICADVALTGADTKLSIPNLAASGTIAVINASQNWTSTQNFTGASTIVHYNTDINAVTTTATTSAITSATFYTNTGDADGATITLMNDPTAGTHWNFAVTAAQTLTIVASTGETLKHGASTCGTSLTSSTVGSTITIWTVVGGSGGSLYTLGATGTWTCNALFLPWLFFRRRRVLDLAKEARKA